MKEYRDYYFRKARAENYPARSVYKLQEIDAKYRLLRKGARVLDLGASPGSWSLYSAEKVGAAGLVLGCDLKPVERPFPPQVKFMREDIFNPSADFEAELKVLGPFDVVLSDMAPATTGDKFTDQARSFNLARAALDFALSSLRAGGAFVVKIFMGPDSQELLAEIRRCFASAKTFKPKSSRSESREIFFIGQCRKSG